MCHMDIGPRWLSFFHRRENDGDFRDGVFDRQSLRNLGCGPVAEFAQESRPWFWSFFSVFSPISLFIFLSVREGEGIPLMYLLMIPNVFKEK
jgi:hypothetical protein